MTVPRHIRIFLSSPGDVSKERSLARKVIKERCWQRKSAMQ